VFDDIDRPEVRDNHWPATGKRATVTFEFARALAEVPVAAGTHLTDRQTKYTIDVLAKDGRGWRIGEATQVVAVERMVGFNVHAVPTEALVKKVVVTLEKPQSYVTLGKIRFMQRT
jgi:hypothetical protein